MDDDDDTGNPDKTANDEDASDSDVEMEAADIDCRKGGGSREKAPIKLFFEKGKDGSRECRVCQYVSMIFFHMRIVPTCLFRKIKSKNDKYHVTTYGAKTGNSSMKKHLKSQHAKAYEMLCRLEECNPNEVPKTLDMDSLDTWFPKKAPAKSFSGGEFALLVLKFIVACDLVSQFSISYIELD